MDSLIDWAKDGYIDAILQAREEIEAVNQQVTEERNRAILSQRKTEALLLGYLAENVSDTNYHHALRIAESACEWTDTILPQAFQKLAEVYASHGSYSIPHWKGDKAFHENTVILEFSPTSQTLLADERYDLILYDVESQQRVRTYRKPHRHNTILDARFSPDGSYIISGGRDTKVTSHQVSTGERISGYKAFPIKRMNTWIQQIACSPDNTTAVVIDGTSSWKLINYHTGELILQRRHHYSPAPVVKFLSEESILLFGVNQKSFTPSFEIWQLDQDEPIREVPGQFAKVNTIEIHSSQYLMTGDDDGIILLTDLQSGNAVDMFYVEHKGSWGKVTAISSHPSGQYFAALNPPHNRIYVFDIDKPVPIATLPVQSNFGKNITFSPDGKYLASNAFLGKIRIWEMEAIRDTYTWLQSANIPKLSEQEKQYYGLYELTSEKLKVNELEVSKLKSKDSP